MRREEDAMPSQRSGPHPSPAERRLEKIRGGAGRRSPTVRVLADFAQHTDCNLAALAFAASVDFDRLLVGTRFQMPFGQSPFAFRRGLAFEKLLREDDYSATVGLLGTELDYDATNLR